ncbi:MAG: hypothetical protein FXF47_07485 [Candidatus Mcinerneyibacterium aminivorans]|uniref:Uncharacterized protein n=1 Tax=Candidatus Mcinerneyibacterium aminivorans TaxID=2703815 RepID=A0A5D0MJP1_9BACT|nr:MAG: hypothetical protein FXF47_07485 [Candidatus Mcinerneyibacterium aminivorans]
MGIKIFCIVDNYILSKLKNILVEIYKVEKNIYKNKIETAFRKINEYKPDLIFCESNHRIIEYLNFIKYKIYKPCLILISEKRKFLIRL